MCVPLQNVTARIHTCRQRNAHTKRKKERKGNREWERERARRWNYTWLFSRRTTRFSNHFHRQHTYTHSNACRLSSFPTNIDTHARTQTTPTNRTIFLFLNNHFSTLCTMFPSFHISICNGFCSELNPDDFYHFQISFFQFFSLYLNNYLKMNKNRIDAITESTNMNQAAENISIHNSVCSWHLIATTNSK